MVESFHDTLHGNIAVGVFWKDNSCWNRSEPVYGYRQTNQVHISFDIEDIFSKNILPMSLSFRFISASWVEIAILEYLLYKFNIW